MNKIQAYKYLLRTSTLFVFARLYGFFAFKELINNAVYFNQIYVHQRSPTFVLLPQIGGL